MCIRDRLKHPRMDKILATSVGVSGASVEELSKESETRTYYNDFRTSLELASNVAGSMNGKMYCPVIFWMQGEFNYDPNPEKGLRANVPNTTDKQEYKLSLIHIFSRLCSFSLSGFFMGKYERERT